nr:unnamed protein product [Digitaria exilis]
MELDGASQQLLAAVVDGAPVRGPHATTAMRSSGVACGTPVGLLRWWLCRATAQARAGHGAGGGGGVAALPCSPPWWLGARGCVGPHSAQLFS